MPKKISIRKHKAMKYFIIDKSNNILLQKVGEDYRVPQELNAQLPDESLVFDMKDKIGEEAYAFGFESSTDVDYQNAVADAELVPLRTAYNLLDYKDYLSACRASAWVYWERTNRFCPICGAKLSRHMDMGKKCPDCGAEHFPHLAPASIVRITRKSDPSLDKDDEILLVHAKNFRRSHMFGLVAGFLEGGETLEECTRREVKEEVGIEIKNIRYFGSQPWPYPSGVMIGFTAEYAGGEIRMDDGELSEAQFFRKDNLPQIPDKMSIARQLIDAWLEA